MKRRLLLYIALLGMCVAPAVLDAAEISFIIGSVEVNRSGRWDAVKAGAAIGEGDLVKTGAKSLAIISLSRGSVIKLRENTALRFEKFNTENLSGAKLELSTGSIFSKILRDRKSQGFTMKAGTVVASIRGTEFFTAFGRSTKKGGDVWLCVNEGTVEVRSETGKGKELVPAGKGILVTSGGKITPPKEYAWTTDLNWNMDPASGDVKDTTNLDKAYGDLLERNYD